MWTEISIIVGFTSIYTIVTVVYALWQNTTANLGDPTFNVLNAWEFFTKMFTFSVPNTPAIFSVFWWLMAFALGIAVTLLIVRVIGTVVGGVK